MKTTTASLLLAILFSLILIVTNLFSDKAFAQLINISTRGFVGTGSNVLIAGFIVGGTTPVQVLVRARGPSMSGAPFSLQGTLANPFLQILSGQSVIAQNDNWQDVQPAEIRATGLDPCEPNPSQSTAPPGCSLESAILVTLPPGAYTAMLSGVSGGTGVGLVEVFEVTGATFPPNVLGTYSGSMTFTQANCQNPSNNATFNFFAALNISAQDASVFSGSGSFATGAATINVFGTVTGGGAVRGSFTTVAVPSLPSGTFDSSGTFTGSIIGKTITMNFSGQGTVDTKCIVSGVLSGTRP
ncbi:MAG TPA: hypothetical protein VF452_21555 [Candidatus Binatia bacterium]